MGFSGVVLAGGRSSRFGQDKAEYELNGKPLLAWVLASLDAADERFIVANKPYRDYGVPVYKDLIVSQSPLSGVHTALKHAKHDWVAVAACDLPYLTPCYWDALSGHCRDKEAVVVRRSGRLEPLAAFYNKSVTKRAEHCLKTGDLALHSFVTGISAQIVAWDSLTLPEQSLRNINRPDDLV